MRLRAKIDENQTRIVDALRDAGCSVETRLAKLGRGIPDLLVGLRGQNFVLEVKRGKKPSERGLTEDEKAWHSAWRGQVDIVATPEDALRAVGLL